MKKVQNFYQSLQGAYDLKKVKNDFLIICAYKIKILILSGKINNYIRFFNLSVHT